MAVVASLAVLAACETDRDPTRTAASRDRDVDALALAWAPGRIDVGGGYVWVAARRRPLLARVDATTAALRHQTLSLSKVPIAVAVAGDADSVWLTAFLAILRVDPRTPALVATLRTKGDPTLNLVEANGLLWTANLAEGPTFVYRFDPATNTEVAREIRVDQETVDLAAGAGSVWTLSHDEATVTRIDARTGRIVAVIELGSEPHAMAFGEGALWVSNYHENSVSRIDPATNEVVAEIALDFPPERIAAGAGYVWVLPAVGGSLAREGDDRVARIDPSRNVVAETLRIGGTPQDVAVGAGAVWFTTQTPNRLLRLRASS